ncbi:hypothetical protein JCM10207_006393 [Rhodosporidiobolus poonsookiae]
MPPSAVDRLPLELLETILEDAAALASFRSYAARQAFLHSACLVSKKFDAVARPILWREVLIDGYCEVGSYAEQVENWGRYTRTLNVGAGVIFTVWGFWKAMFRLIEGMPNLEELYLPPSEEEVELGDGELALLQGLRRLALPPVSFSAPLPVFPNLTALAVRCYTARDPVLNLLSPTRFPALRSLSFDLTSRLEISHLRVDPALVAQLALHDIGENFTGPDRTVVAPTSTVLIHHPAQFIELAREGQLVFTIPWAIELSYGVLESWPTPEDAAEALRLLDSSIKNNVGNPGICAVVLPSFLHPAWSSDGPPSGIDAPTWVKMLESSSSVLRRCKEEKVRVFWRREEARNGTAMRLPLQELVEFAVNRREAAEAGER